MLPIGRSREHEFQPGVSGRDTHRGLGHYTFRLGARLLRWRLASFRPWRPRCFRSEGLGNMSFSQEFLEEIRTEGWGITRFGWALGYYGGAWHRSDRGALDASDRKVSGT